MSENKYTRIVDEQLYNVDQRAYLHHRQEKLQLCVKMAIGQYEREHPCEHCIWMVKLPVYEPPQQGKNVDQAFDRHLEKIGNKVKKHVTNCKSLSNGYNAAELQYYKKCCHEQKGDDPGSTCCLCLLIFKLRIVFEYDDKEIGKILGVSEDTAKQRAFRCFKRMRENWRNGNNQFKKCYDRFIVGGKYHADSRKK